MSDSSFGAAPTLLGYLYQCELALTELLRRMKSSPTVAVSIELLDDVAFEDDGTPADLLQTKHHIRSSGSISNASVDLWKTLRVWVETAGAPDDENVLTLVTTATASEGSVAASLRVADRDEAAALKRLEEVARTSATQENAEAYKAFLGLDETSRRNLVRRVVVADRAPNIAALDDVFEAELRVAAPAARRAALTARLRGWWHERVVKHLLAVAAGASDRISAEEVELKIADLRDQLTEENLPIDFFDMPAPEDDEIAQDLRPFVQQLRLIALRHKRLRLAIQDHNRAFAQRSTWMREELLDYGELERFEANLKDEWEHAFAALADVADDASEEERQQAGTAVFDHAERQITVRIRPKCSAPYVTRGSVHMLADALRIGWHPDWVERVHHVLNTAEEAA